MNTGLQAEGAVGALSSHLAAALRAQYEFIQVVPQSREPGPKVLMSIIEGTWKVVDEIEVFLLCCFFCFVFVLRAHLMRSLAFFVFYS